MSGEQFRVLEFNLIERNTPNTVGAADASYEQTLV